MEELQEYKDRLRIVLPSDRQLEFYLRTELFDQPRIRNMYTSELSPIPVWLVRRTFDMPTCLTFYQGDDGTWEIAAIHAGHDMRMVKHDRLGYTFGLIAPALRGRDNQLLRRAQMQMVEELFFRGHCHIDRLLAVVLDSNEAGKRWARDDCEFSVAGVMRRCMPVFIEGTDETTLVDGLVLSWNAGDEPLAWSETNIRCQLYGGPAQPYPG